MPLFEYHGAPARIVALDLEIDDGQQVYGPDELELASGFVKITKAKLVESRAINSPEDAASAVVGGSGEQTEADR